VSPCFDYSYAGIPETSRNGSKASILPPSGKVIGLSSSGGFTRAHVANDAYPPSGGLIVRTNSGLLTEPPPYSSYVVRRSGLKAVRDRTIAIRPLTPRRSLPSRQSPSTITDRDAATAREQRRVATIVAADVVEYSRLMGREESGTLAALKGLRREIFDPSPPIAGVL
jgi:hypothetical protein